MTKPGTSIALTLDQKSLETMATGSLTGIVIEMMNTLGHGYILPERLVLKFPQTSAEWKKRYHGPDFIVIPEYTLPCLIQCMLNLQVQGVNVTVAIPVKEDKDLWETFASAPPVPPHPPTKSA